MLMYDVYLYLLHIDLFPHMVNDDSQIGIVKYDARWNEMEKSIVDDDYLVLKENKGL
jgi:hypothetical protein